MKKLYLCLCLVFLRQISYAQGKDVILYMDGSSSISTADFNSMRPSVDAMIQGILNCSENNRLAVVHFSTVADNAEAANIFIESDFTSDPSVALSYMRRTNGFPFGTFDHPHASLTVLENALDAIPNTHIFGPVTQLTTNPQNELVVLMVTDACRQNVLGTATFGLLNPYSYAFGSNLAFQNYTDFKNERLARFVVVLSPDPIRGSRVAAANAAASIASAAGGSYNSGIESYPADPQFGEGNRYLTVNSDNNFVFSSEQIIQIVSDVCEECLNDLTLSSPDNDVTATSFQKRNVSITASNHINNAPDGRAIYHAGGFVELIPGFETMQSAQFAASIEDCNQGFVYKQEIFANKPSKDFQNLGKILVFPNPSNSSITISYDNALKNVSIFSMDGKTIRNEKVSGNEHQIDVSTFANGLYMVTVETQSGKFLQSRFVKN